MVRSIILSLLPIAIMPLTLAKAIAISEDQIILPQEAEPKINLENYCLSSNQISSCSSFKANKVEIDSELWLKNITQVLLSGSMFSRCRMSSGTQQYSKQQPLRASLPKMITPGCLLAWQNSLPEKMVHDEQDQSFVAIENTSNLADRDNLASLTSPLETTAKFPKLSRSSLIVSLPMEDTSFIPPNTKLANPAPGTKRIASPFGWRRRPYSNQLQFHQGIDYGAPLGSPVVAVGDGIVTKIVSGCDDFGNLFCGGQLGNWIEIDHGNGHLGLYGHLKNDSITVKEGMKVWKNQEIAQVGSSGWSTGAHLDFRLKVNGEFDDPAKYLTPPNLSEL